MRLFSCPVCQQQVYFENSVCLACGSAIAFAPDLMQMVTVGAADGAHRTCVQRTTSEACNWAIETADPIERCRSCRLTGAESATGADWLRARAEAAKRQVLYTLLQLGVPFAPKMGDDDLQGLRFVWALPAPGGPTFTGQMNGTITLNLNEADDAHREATRVSFGEPQRTVLGHLRHELSHYFFHRFVEGWPAIEDFRATFGDERVDYNTSLERHYQQGPAADWQQHFVSAYASAHPWEDWAETCAHYLLMVDAVDTAAAWGLQLSSAGSGAPVQPEQAVATAPVERLVLDHWLPLARFLNAMARSLGLADSYPYLLPPPVLGKLRLVQHALIGDLRAARSGA
jgi:hypothetical protein